jgi:hypothetical protein
MTATDLPDVDDGFFPAPVLHQPSGPPTPLMWAAHTPDELGHMLAELDVWVTWLVDHYRLDRRYVPSKSSPRSTKRGTPRTAPPPTQTLPSHGTNASRAPAYGWPSAPRGPAAGPGPTGGKATSVRERPTRPSPRC